MERKELWGRLHLSAIDGQAAALAGKWGLGFEIAEFCWAPRLEQPDASLAQLAPLLDPPVSRSGLSHRFKRLQEIAETLRERREHG